MCRYVIKNYKPHYACFTCRKVFRKVRIDDYFKQRRQHHVFSHLGRMSHLKKRFQELEAIYGVTLQALSDKYHSDIQKCPQCGENMANMGLDFRAPNREAKKAWKIIQSMYTYGRRFHSCGCDGPGFIPTNPTDYRNYLLQTLAEYQSCYAQWQKSDTSDRHYREQRLVALSVWSQRINKIEKVLY